MGAVITVTRRPDAGDFLGRSTEQIRTMLALLAVWVSLAALTTALTMALYRPAFVDWTIPIALYGSAAAICFGGLVLWSHRTVADGEAGVDPGIAAQRMQSKVAIGLGLLAAAIVYVLVIYAKPVQRIEPAGAAQYDAAVPTVVGSARA